MKKAFLGFVVLAMVASCKKVPDGGNKNILKLEEGVERYDTHEERGGHSTQVLEHKTAIEVEVNGAKLQAFQGGLEQQLVDFLSSGEYTKATDDEALKEKWYNFDNVNFKIGSSSELETGSEVQLANLVAILKAYPDVKIKIGGYTDKTGNEENNKKISQNRANFIKNELSKAGVGNQVVSAEGYGSEFAKVSADASDEERAIDRKMAVRFTK